MNNEYEAHLIKIIKELTIKHLGKCVEPQFIAKGSKSHVYKIDDIWVIKLNTQDQRYLTTEKRLIEICLEAGIKAPEIGMIGDFEMTKKNAEGKDIQVKINYGFQKFVNGHPLESSSINKEIFYALSKDLAKLHKISMPGFGRLDLSTVGEYETWNSYLKTNIKDEYVDLAKTTLPNITNHVIDFCREIDFQNGKFCFGDLKFDNIILSNKRFGQLIDFDYCLAGDPMYDFATYDFYCDFNNVNPKTKRWIRYGGVDEKKVLEYKRVIAFKKYGVYTLRDTEIPARAEKARDLLASYFA